MGKELTIVAVVGAFIFGMWYFNKGGCEGNGAAGLTGPDATLCWNGPSIEEMLGKAAGGDPEAVPGPEEESGSDEPPTDPGGSPDDIARMEAGQRKIIASGHTQDRLPSGKPKPIEAAWAHAYYTNNRITVA